MALVAVQNIEVDLQEQAEVEISDEESQNTR
jgi:hypothetical protein